ncbi:MAG: aminotransferase class I/II-fold pyridoxal phosphate-dependent enzyme [Oscillospiraceae bacterium]|nr:aminotransferase class I/II-fold pyridoxal phosphate-dependent enzyme [Oscillospiraceae bacterium]
MNSLSKFLADYASSDFARFHVPGHMGNCDFINNISPKLDITEIDGSDSLYQSNGIISDLESQISNLFNAQSVISAGGSTLCIQTMLCLIKNRQIIAMRGSHISFYNTCALLGISPNWIEASLNEFSSTTPTASDVEVALLKESEPAAVYITSPNYYGVCADIAEISKICKKYGALLVVDNAHGSHLNFTLKNMHPISLGADICCDSFHKTLPTLTGAAVLHTKPRLFDKEQIKYAMSLFGSTSPSYLIMYSIGLCVDWLEKSGKLAFESLELQKKELIKKTGVKVLETDCSKITIDCSYVGKSGNCIAKFLRTNKIEPEYADERYVVLMLSPFLSSDNWCSLGMCLEKLPQKSNACKNYEHKFTIPKMAMSLQNAYFSESTKVPAKSSLGKICARCEWECPPGIPIVVAGEIINDQTIDLLNKNNIDFIYVIK